MPVRARFSAPIQTGPGAHSASYTMGTGSFLELKRPERGVDHPSPSSAKVKERVELYLYSPSGPLWPAIGWTLPYLCQGTQRPEGKAYHSSQSSIEVKNGSNHASAPPFCLHEKHGQIYLSYFNSGKFEVVTVVTMNMTCQGCDMSPLPHSSTS